MWTLFFFFSHYLKEIGETMVQNELIAATINAAEQADTGFSEISFLLFISTTPGIQCVSP